MSFADPQSWRAPPPPLLASWRAPAGPRLPAELHLPGGLVGLPHLRRFAVRTLPGTSLLELLSVDDPAFGFVAIPADEVRSGMTARLVEEGLVTPGALLLALLALHGEPPAVTANLAGPIVVEPAAGTARQTVLDDPAFPLRAPVGASA